MPTPNKPKTKTQRFKEFSEAATIELLRLSADHDYPLSRQNWAALREEISRKLIPHFDAAENQVNAATAARTGVDLEALKERIDNWRAEEDLLTPDDVMQRLGIIFAEVHAAQHLDFIPFVPIPSTVTKVPEKYLPENHWRNYRRADVEALGPEQLAVVAETATMMRHQAAELLGIHSRDFDAWANYIQPCDTVKTPGAYGKPLYRVSEVRRLKQQLAINPMFLAMQRNHANGTTGY